MARQGAPRSRLGLSARRSKGDTPATGTSARTTYRTLTAVDSAVMVLDAAEGIKGQTCKLFEVCARCELYPKLILCCELAHNGCAAS